MSTIHTWSRRVALLAGIAGIAAALPAGAQTAANAYGTATNTYGTTANMASWSAIPTTGLYIAGNVGPNWLLGYELHPKTSFNQSLTNAGYAVSPGKTNFNIGVAGGLALGWGFGNGLRAELEGSYHGNNFKTISGFNAYRNGSFIGSASTANAATNPNGTQQTPAVMVNAYYDFHIAEVPWMIPYVGAGIGVGFTSIAHNNVNYVTPNGAASLGLTGNSSSTMLAYQGMLGAAFPIESVPGLYVTAEGRYFGTQQPKYNGSLVFNSNTLASGSIKGYNNNISALFGLRYAFNAPVPAPIPVAAPAAAARTYLVFFDWDRYHLTDRARQIIAEAAQTAKTTGSTRIEVAGHTDRTGTAQYNERLSIRRAEAVAAELVRRGVPRNEIAISGYGYSRPLVPTAAGVREPQNRRVEIVLK
jgi:OmpA-OmpF porin, OOP family